MDKKALHVFAPSMHGLGWVRRLSNAHTWGWQGGMRKGSTAPQSVRRPLIYCVLGLEDSSLQVSDDFSWSYADSRASSCERLRLHQMSDHNGRGLSAVRSWWEKSKDMLRGRSSTTFLTPSAGRSDAGMLSPVRPVLCCLPSSPG